MTKDVKCTMCQINEFNPNECYYIELGTQFGKWEELEPDISKAVCDSCHNIIRRLVEN